MLQILADENFNNAIVRGLLRALPGVDILTVQQDGLMGMKDPDLLGWVWDHCRIIITHDVQSMEGHIKSRLAAGLGVLGVIAVPERLPIGRAIYELSVCIGCTEPEEWRDQMARVPL
jgi:hypothetical protein